MSKIFENDQFSKQELPIRCPQCAMRVTIRNGSYKRAHPEENCQIRIQRYLCKYQRCPRKTFSVQPYPLLPVLRHFYETVLLCHKLFTRQQMTLASMARHLNVTPGRAKRLGTFCHQFFHWLSHEQKVADWGAALQDNAAEHWVDFTRDFSRRFYPNRWPKALPTQYKPI
ncbi:transposase [Desulfogranum japonicum]|uniref:transposase n=1 Tax=Desulfogranum japonicum TaxID=231447 RepID=UPI0004024662|nr:transposase [Desulfogranum japonicum]